MKRRHITAMFGLMIMAMAVGISVCAEENTDAAAQAIADRRQRQRSQENTKKWSLLFTTGLEGRPEQIEFRKR